MRSESISHIFFSSCCCSLCVHRSTEQEWKKKINNTTSFLLSSVIIELKQCDIYTSHGCMCMCALACFVTQPATLNADVNGKIVGIVLFHSLKRNMRELNVAVCVCVCVMIPLNYIYAKCWMRYNFLIIPNAAHNTIVSSPTLFAVSYSRVEYLIKCIIWNVIW